MNEKPLGRKAYGHIPHLPGSRMGPGDHSCHEGQARICTLKARDKHDHITVTEKLDGSNCSIARLEDGWIVALTRAGYHASTSRYEQHHFFDKWVMSQLPRWDSIKPGQRVVGEWLAQAHSTRYLLTGEPFVPFDLMVGERRLPHSALRAFCLASGLRHPMILFDSVLSINGAMHILNGTGFHGATDPVEGAVWRVERDELIDKKKGGERHRVVDFLAKYVRPEKVDGCFLPEITGQPAIWNWSPDGQA